MGIKIPSSLVAASLTNTQMQSTHAAFAILKRPHFAASRTGDFFLIEIHNVTMHNAAAFFGNVIVKFALHRQTGPIEIGFTYEHDVFHVGSGAKSFVAARRYVDWVDRACHI